MSVIKGRLSVQNSSGQFHWVPFFLSKSPSPALNKDGRVPISFGLLDQGYVPTRVDSPLHSPGIKRADHWKTPRRTPLATVVSRVQR